jgi:hypothetical protein
MKLAFLLLLLPTYVIAQAIYDTNRQYKSYSQLSPSGVTMTYNTQDQSMGSSQINNGQRNY